MVPVRREYPVAGGSGGTPSSDSAPYEQGQSTSGNSPVTGVPSASVSSPNDLPPVVTESSSGYPGHTETKSESDYPLPTETKSDSGSISIPIFSTSKTDAAGGNSGTYPTIAPPERF